RGGSVGVDRATAHLATWSDGAQSPTRRLLADSKRELERLQRQRDRQHRAGSPKCFEADGTHKKGPCQWTDKSRAARTTQAQITRLHDLLRRRRAGYLHEITKTLATRHEAIAIEDLNTAGMTARAKPKQDPDNPGHYLPNRRRTKAGLNRAILGVGIFEFNLHLTHY